MKHPISVSIKPAAAQSICFPAKSAGLTRPAKSKAPSRAGATGRGLRGKHHEEALSSKLRFFHSELLFAFRRSHAVVTEQCQPTETLPFAFARNASRCGSERPSVAYGNVQAQRGHPGWCPSILLAMYRSRPATTSTGADISNSRGGPGCPASPAAKASVHPKLGSSSAESASTVQRARSAFPMNPGQDRPLGNSAGKPTQPL